MFGMCNEGDILEHYANLNIVPVSMSYEFDPCDGRKAQELYIEQTDGNYEKSDTEDLESMKQGIILPKGKGHIHFDKPLNNEILKLPLGEKKSILMNGISELIDEKIQSNYKIWTSTLLANEMLNGPKVDTEIEESNNDEFKNRLNGILDDLEGDRSQLKEIILGMYQQPLLNYIKRKKNSTIS